METLRIRLQQPIPGIDHLQAIDAEKFADLHGRWDDIAPLLDVDRINDFYVHEGEHGKFPIKWHRAAKGLHAVRTILEYYQSGKGILTAAQRAEVIEVFQAVESILDEADLREIRFCLVGNY